MFKQSNTLVYSCVIGNALLRSGTYIFSSSFTGKIRVFVKKLSTIYSLLYLGPEYSNTAL